jgi:uncharacterized protein (DUF3084 family)
VNRARARREATRRLAETRAQLEAAGDALTGADASLRQAETRFGAADARVDAARGALDEAWAELEAARRERCAAWQAHEQASAMVERLQRRVSELTGQLSRMP